MKIQELKTKIIKTNNYMEKLRLTTLLLDEINKNKHKINDTVKEYIVDFLYDEGVEVRICSECGALMEDGYVIDGGMQYYCGDECLHKHFTAEEWLEEYKNNDSYWTEWN
ncbi:hypothetical protein [Terrisporobacter sp.]|uniref:hypothetical protein n=1 Tax=Terrisporobacter sp. TaxID=1965305 RepID=UPI003993BC12